MIKIEINGISIEARDGATVIEAADDAGITIPRFCYHKKLSIAASCRMCLVEVEKVAKPLPACATPVTEGMKVLTRSPKAIAAQRAVMEFLLINHPLDCPICDQGGECDLQEMAMGYGKDVSNFSEGKRVVADKNIGPLIATDMTRCIHCTRCVRFGQEVAGVMEMGAAFRGEHMRIGTFVERTVDSELSGNMIDLCPVGALTSKPYRYSARPWELAEHASISPHDAVGANINIETRGGKVMRVLPRDNEAVNEMWLADRDRFSYTALYHGERLTTPKVRRNGRWEDTDWDTALTLAAEGLKRVVNAHGGKNIGVLAGYGGTTEEFYLLKKLARGLGSGNVDHRLLQRDFRDQDTSPAYPSLGVALADVENLNAALIIGSNVRKDQPLIGHRLRKAALAGGQMMFLNPVDFEFHFPIAEKLVVAPSRMVNELGAIAKALLELGGDAPEGFSAFAQGIAVSEDHRAIARRLRDGKKAAVLVGSGAIAHPAQADIRSLAALVAQLADAQFGQIPEGGNAAGAALAGVLPHRDAAGKAAATKGMDWLSMARAGLKGWMMLGLEPEHDAVDPAPLLSALAGAEFVVSLSSYASDKAYEYAHVLLPVSTFAETSGTFINANGQWQSFAAAGVAPGQVRPAWKVLRVLGNLMDVSGFDYLSSEEIRDELRVACDGIARTATPWRRPEGGAVAKGLERVVEFPIYAVDAMVRRAEPLQATADGRRQGVFLNPTTAKSLGLTEGCMVVAREGDYQASLPVVFEPRVPEGVTLIPVGHKGMGSAGLQTVTLTKA